jgi:hypothetical protein
VDDGTSREQCMIWFFRCFGCYIIKTEPDTVDQSIQKLELDLTPNTKTSVQCFGVGEKMSTTSQLVV